MEVSETIYEEERGKPRKILLHHIVTKLAAEHSIECITHAGRLLDRFLHLVTL